MQTYLEYNLLRSFISRVRMLLILFLSGSAFASEMESKADSLFASWSDHKNTVPLVAFDLNRFEDEELNRSIEQLTTNYGAGLVYLSDGKSEEVKQWTESLRDNGSQALIAVRVSKVFELPFTDLSRQPKQLMVETLTDEKLVESLADYHAEVLNALGINLIHYDYLPPKYNETEWQKLKTYWEVLEEHGLGVSFGNGARDFVSKYQKQINWKQVRLMESAVIEHEVLKKKKLFRKFRQETGFDGLVTERWNRSSLTDNKYNQWESGVDVLCLDNFTNHHDVLNQVIQSGVLSKHYFKSRLREYYGLRTEIGSSGISKDGLPAFSPLLQYQLESSAVALIKDDQNYFPIQNLNRQSFYVFSSQSNREQFHHMVDLYKRSRLTSLESLLIPLDSFRLYVPVQSHLLIDLTTLVHLQEIEKYVTRIQELSREYHVGVFYQGNSSNLSMLSELANVVWSAQGGDQALNLMVQMAFGAMPFKGQVPGYLFGMDGQIGVIKNDLARLRYSDPEVVGVNGQKLAAIDSIIDDAVRQEMFPGCQVLMVKDGAVVYNRSFGHLTYDSLDLVRWDHLYDVASITKTAATVPMVMQEVALGNFDLNGRLGDYSVRYSQSDKSKLVLSDLLAHQAGLKSYVPFWRQSSYQSDSAAYLYKQHVKRREYEYLPVNWQDSVSSWIATSPFNSLMNPDSTYRYLYSDLGFMIMKDIVEEKEGVSIDYLVDSLFYRPMSMDFTTFNPLRHFPENQIAPTEMDNYLRHNLVRGQVHDRNAALLGGVSGHAGLFSNSNDLAKYMQMLLQQGYYGGYQYFDSALVATFTETSGGKNIRGLGWDKPRMEVSNASQYASSQSFGHSGFTGTLVWADPEYDLVYIFLSNRVYPDPENNKLIRSNTRTKIHDSMYEAILSAQEVANQKM